MALLLILPVYLGASWWLAHWLASRSPAASRLLLRFNRGLALVLLALGLYALTQPADGRLRISLACLLLALGLWTLPPPQPGEPPPAWRERLQRARPWMAGLLLLALARIVLLEWAEPGAPVPGAKASMEAGAPAVAADASDEALVFHSLGPRRTEATPRVGGPVGREPTAPVDEPEVVWRLVERVFAGARERPPAQPPVVAESNRRTAPPVTPDNRAPDPRIAGRAAPFGAPSRQAGSREPLPPSSGQSAPVPAGVNPAVINNMLARAETLLREGRRQEAAAVAGNVLAFDPANPAARRIREVAGSSLSGR